MKPKAIIRMKEGHRRRGVEEEVRKRRAAGVRRLDSVVMMRLLKWFQRFLVYGVWEACEREQQSSSEWRFIQTSAMVYLYQVWVRERRMPKDEERRKVESLLSIAAVQSYRSESGHSREIMNLRAELRLAKRVKKDDPSASIKAIEKAFDVERCALLEWMRNDAAKRRTQQQLEAQAKKRLDSLRTQCLRTLAQSRERLRAESAVCAAAIKEREASDRRLEAVRARADTLTAETSRLKESLRALERRNKRLLNNASNGSGNGNSALSTAHSREMLERRRREFFQLQAIEEGDRRRRLAASCLDQLNTSNLKQLKATLRHTLNQALRPDTEKDKKLLALTDSTTEKDSAHSQERWAAIDAALAAIAEPQPHGGSIEDFSDPQELAEAVADRSSLLVALEHLASLDPPDQQTTAATTVRGRTLALATLALAREGQCHLDLGQAIHNLRLDPQAPELQGIVHSAESIVQEVYPHHEENKEAFSHLKHQDRATRPSTKAIAIQTDDILLIDAETGTHNEEDVHRQQCLRDAVAERQARETQQAVTDLRSKLMTASEHIREKARDIALLAEREVAAEARAEEALVRARGWALKATTTPFLRQHSLRLGWQSLAAAKNKTEYERTKRKAIHLATRVLVRHYLLSRLRLVFRVWRSAMLDFGTALDADSLADALHPPIDQKNNRRTQYTTSVSSQGGDADEDNMKALSPAAAIAKNLRAAETALTGLSETQARDAVVQVLGERLAGIVAKETAPPEATVLRDRFQALAAQNAQLAAALRATPRDSAVANAELRVLQARLDAAGRALDEEREARHTEVERLRAELSNAKQVFAVERAKLTERLRDDASTISDLTDRAITLERQLQARPNLNLPKRTADAFLQARSAAETLDFYARRRRRKPPALVADTGPPATNGSSVHKVPHSLDREDIKEASSRNSHLHQYNGSKNNPTHLDNRREEAALADLLHHNDTLLSGLGLEASTGLIPRSSSAAAAASGSSARTTVV